MWTAATGVLLHRYRQGEAGIDAYAEDYACLIFGLLELFQADPDVAWLDWAVALQRRQDALFRDDRAGGWFSTTGTDPNVLLRMKEDYDGAEPTASSVSVMNLIVLSHLIDDGAWTEQIDRTLASFGERLRQIGRAVPMMGAALSAHLAGLRQVVIVGEGPARDALVRATRERYMPFAIVLAPRSDQLAALGHRLPFMSAMKPVDGAAAAYVCRDFTCQAPVTRADALSRLLR
jgi:uncharacterized protein YyaL (SSP411 family)